MVLGNYLGALNREDVVGLQPMDREHGVMDEYLVPQNILQELVHSKRAKHYREVVE